MGTFASILAPSDNLSIRVIRAQPYHKPTFMGLLRSMLSCFPNLRKWDAESQYVNKYKLRNLGPALRGTGWLLVLYMIRSLMLACSRGKRSFAFMYGVLSIRVFRVDGTIHDLGVVCHLLITTAGVNKLVAGMNASDTATFSIFKFHGHGTGVGAPAVGDTALGTEATTQYNPDSTRPTGTQTTGGSSNVYRTVGVFTHDSGSAYSPSETGLFSQAATGGGTLLDRFQYTAVPLQPGDSMQTTIDITLPAGS
jgi:hypothetical protein